MYYYTYLLINNTDGRMYIGSRGCKCLPEEDTNYLSSSKVMSKDYLLDCRKSILKICLTSIEALTHEVYLHKLFDVAINPAFFNAAKQTSIKFDRTGVSQSDAHKKKISEANKISMGTEKNRARMREARTGVIVSDITKQKLRELNLGGNSPKAKKVLCIETSIIYRSVSEAAEAVGIHYSGIAKVCNGTQHKAATYTWKYI